MVFRTWSPIKWPYLSLDAFEAIQIEHQDAKRQTGVVGVCHFAEQAFHQYTPIDHPRQRIAGGFSVGLKQHQLLA